VAPDDRSKGSTSTERARIPHRLRRADDQDTGGDSVVPRRLLVIGAGPLQTPAIVAGQQLGLEVIATDQNPRAHGADVADRFYPISTVDLEATVCVAQELHVDAVLTLGTDYPVRTVAEVARRLGLPGPSTQTARAATDKHLMYLAFREHGVPCPRTELVHSVGEAESAANGVGYPVVVKPTDRSGSAGVAFATEPGAVPQAYRRASAEARGGEVLVQEYIAGDELSVETMSYGSVFAVVAITSKLTTGPPYFVELGHCVPADLDAKTQRLVSDTARRAALALGVTSGPTHTEMKVTGAGATIIELGARLGGDHITSHLVPLATGVSMVNAAIHAALGEQPNLAPTLCRAAAIRYLCPAPGRVRRIQGSVSARSLPGVEGVSVEAACGDLVREVRSSADRVGWVIAVGDTPHEAVLRADNARRAIRIETWPDGSPIR